VVGVQAIDRTPADFYDLKLNPEKTVTAFIVWVQAVRERAATHWATFHTALGLAGFKVSWFLGSASALNTLC
jgi:hypothetical protein